MITGVEGAHEMIHSLAEGLDLFLSGGVDLHKRSPKWMAWAFQIIFEASGCHGRRGWEFLDLIITKIVDVMLSYGPTFLAVLPAKYERGRDYAFSLFWFPILLMNHSQLSHFLCNIWPELHPDPFIMITLLDITQADAKCYDHFDIHTYELHRSAFNKIYHSGIHRTLHERNRHQYEPHHR